MISMRKFRGFPLYKTWTDAQIEQIHLNSMALLERVGVIVYEPESVKLLGDAGAYVEGDLVKIPAALVEQAIRSAPGRITLYAKDGSSQLVLEKGQVNYGMGADVPYFVDPYTEKIRSAVIQDTENASRLAKRLENIDWIASLALASDVTVELADLYQMLALRKYNNKPIMTHSASYQTMKGMIDMAAVSAGGYKELRHKPTFALYTQPVSPLENGKESLEKLLLCAEYGIPVTYATGLMCGGSAPATFAAGIALGNAECLAGLVIHQLKRPGAPFFLGNVGGPLDMRTTIVPYGGPEMTLVQSITGQLGHFYGLPTFGTAGYTDALKLDAQAGMDAAYSILFAALADNSFVHDSGYMGSGISGSLEQLLLANETIGYVKRFMDGIEVNNDTLCLDEIAQAGPVGKYSDDAGKTQLIPGSEYTYARLHEQVLELLGHEDEILLTAHELEQMTKIIKDSEDRLK